jgi:peptide/nickel transport system substrate-binding protein
MSMATYEFRFGNLHNGQPISIVDFCTLRASRWNGPTKRAMLTSSTSGRIPRRLRVRWILIIGRVLNEDDTITVYFDYNSPRARKEL